MARVTIKEIARRCGVSQGAVSYALNNQPGVSAATRARVLRVAAELEWVPNRAARQLSAARSETFGLVLARTVQTLVEEPYFMGFVGGVESVLGEKSYVGQGAGHTARTGARPKAARTAHTLSRRAG